MHDIQAAATGNDAGEDLADHDRHERSPAGRKQRAGETGGHDQREQTKAYLVARSSITPNPGPGA
jgi:hypothetical protein